MESPFPLPHQNKQGIGVIGFGGSKVEAATVGLALKISCTGILNPDSSLQRHAANGQNLETIGIVFHDVMHLPQYFCGVQVLYGFGLGGIPNDTATFRIWADDLNGQIGKIGYQGKSRGGVNNSSREKISVVLELADFFGQLYKIARVDVEMVHESAHPVGSETDLEIPQGGIDGRKVRRHFFDPGT